MARTLGLGFSSCPNDTFMFHGVVRGLVEVPGVRFAPYMADIEALNERARRGPQLEVTKLSVSALGHVLSDYAVLGAGAAIGRGCGPLVVAREPAALGDLRGRVAIPGVGTTAHLLFKLFGPTDVNLTAMRFDRIMPAVAAGECDAGVIIHEGRFTYERHGLVRVADLGELWERDAGLPLPLGVIAAHRELDGDTALAVEAGLRASIRAARDDPSRPADYIREHAQDLSPEVCQRHIDLYVNAFSVDLGAEGREAITTLMRRGHAIGVLPDPEALRFAG